MNWFDFICLWIGYLAVVPFILIVGAVAARYVYLKVSGRLVPLDDHDYPSEPRYNCPRCDGSGWVFEHEMTDGDLPPGAAPTQ